MRPPHHRHGGRDPHRHRHHRQRAVQADHQPLRRGPHQHLRRRGTRKGVPGGEPVAAEPQQRHHGQRRHEHPPPSRRPPQQPRRVQHEKRPGLGPGQPGQRPEQHRLAGPAVEVPPHGPYAQRGRDRLDVALQPVPQPASLGIRGEQERGHCDDRGHSADERDPAVAPRLGHGQGVRVHNRRTRVHNRRTRVHNRRTRVHAAQLAERGRRVPAGPPVPRPPPAPTAQPPATPTATAAAPPPRTARAAPSPAPGAASRRSFRRNSASPASARAPRSATPTGRSRRSPATAATPPRARRSRAAAPG